MENFCWSKLDILYGSTRQWICFTLDTVYIWMQFVDLPESGFAVYLDVVYILKWTACRTHSLNIWIFVLLDAEQITGNRHCVLVDAMQIIRQITGYSGQT